MKYLHIIPTILVAFSAQAYSQVMPQQAPHDTYVGGTGAATASLSKLELSKPTVTIQNLEGPDEGKGRERTGIFVKRLTPLELPGINRLSPTFIRSSYVTLDPGGFSPIHSHRNRPAFLQVISGSVKQHRSDGVSFVMGPGDFTFSSDDLVHWWVNESPDQPMTLWIVELCGPAHGVVEEVEGGAVKLESLPQGEKNGNFVEGEILMEIDLAGEFREMAGIGDRKLQLRRHTVLPGKKAPIFYGGSAFVRIHQGQGSGIKEGEVAYAYDSDHGTWTNDGKATAILYSIAITIPVP